MTFPAIGVHDGVSFRDYHALDAWGSSALRAMRLGPPALVPWQREHPTPETDATRLGTAAHCRILTPKLFGQSYVVRPDDAPDRPTKAMREAAKPSEASKARVAFWDAFDRDHAGKCVLRSDEAAAVRDITEAFRTKRLAAEALDAAKHVEASMVWRDPYTDEVCKGRPDWFDDEAIYDLKVSRHAGPDVVRRAFYEGWMHQLAHYRQGLFALDGNWRAGRLVVIGPKPPQGHRVFCLEVKDGALDVLALENTSTLRALKQCRESGEWPSTPDEWKKCEPPQSALMETVFLTDAEEVEE